MPGIISGKKIKVPKEIDDILGEDEDVLLSFQQAGMGGKITGLESIVITDRRVIKMHPKTLGLRAQIEDHLYKDRANVKLDKGMFRSSISINMRFMAEPVSIENIPKDGANEAFKMIQNGISGGFGGGESVYPKDASSSSPENDIIEQIRKLGELKESGIITDDEFQEKKKDL